MLKAWQGLHANYLHDLGDAIDVTTVTNDHFNEWRISGYDHTVPVVPYAAPIPVPVAAGGAAALTPAQTFQKGIRKSADNYPILRSDNGWPGFKRQMQSAARMEQTENMLVPTYAPANAEQTELFNVQNSYMLQVFEKILLTNVSKNYLREHTNQPLGAQLVWRDLLNWARQSVTADMTKEKLCTFLTSAKLDGTFPGTLEEWCIKWKDMVQKYETQLGNPVPNADLVNWFCTLVSLNEDLAGVWSKICNARRNVPPPGGGVHPAVQFDNFYLGVVKRAQQCDGTSKRAAELQLVSSQASRARRTANLHDFDASDYISHLGDKYNDGDNMEYLAAVHELTKDFGAFDIDHDGYSEYTAFAASQSSPSSRNSGNSSRASSTRGQSLPPRSAMAGNLDCITYAKLTDHGRRKWDEFHREDKIVITKGTRNRGAVLFANKNNIPIHLTNGVPQASEAVYLCGKKILVLMQNTGLSSQSYPNFCEAHL